MGLSYQGSSYCGADCSSEPDKYKQPERAATACSSEAKSPAESKDGRRQVGAGDNVIRKSASVTGPVALISKIEQVMAFLSDGIPDGTIAVIDDSGGTLTAPIIEGFAGVICLGGSVRSHLGILAREYDVSTLMNCKIDTLADGDVVELEVTAAELRQRFGHDIPDDELLLRLLVPERDIEVMRATPPRNRDFAPATPQMRHPARTNRTARSHTGPMSELKIEADPTEVGLDPQRLARIETHFSRYVDDGRLPGWLVTIRRHGRLAYVASYGSRDTEAGEPVTEDTVWRIYSMSKPITSVAAMMLYEEGKLALTDPVSRFIPSFAGLRVYTGGSDLKQVTEPVTEPMRVWHLLTHTSGLTYGFHRVNPIDALYRAKGYEWGSPPGTDLAQACDDWASIPLLFQPGAEWNYSHSTDVLGRVVEVASGQRLDEFFAERIFTPLGMTGTAFWAGPEAAPRLAALYRPGADGKAVRLDELGVGALKEPRLLGGGGGLVSTAADYDRFTQMLLPTAASPAGELDGVRLLSPRTVDYMGRNHLPGGVDLEAFGRRLFAEAPFHGVGFGLGFAVVIDPVPGKVVCSAGELSWGGAASTAFWLDPAQELTVSFFTQLMPSSTHPIRPELRTLVYQALTD